MGDLFRDYALAAPVGVDAWDELFETRDVPRRAARLLHEALEALSPEEFERRCEARDLRLRDQGITFSLAGHERPFPLDLVPRLLTADEWALIESGVVQRVRTLEAFLADVYGEGAVLADRVVPRRVVTSSIHFHRAAAGVAAPNGVRIHVAGVDIVRDACGVFRVLEDNLRTPSGISYVIENRRIMTRLFPELFASHRVLPVDDYPGDLLAALIAAAPAGSREPWS